MVGAEAAILGSVVFVLLGAKLMGELAERLRQPAVVGELLAGVVLGPTILGLLPAVIGPSAMEAEISLVSVLAFLAQFGALLLLFEVGLESNLRDLVKVGRTAVLVAVVGIVVSLALGYFSSWLLARVIPWPDSGLVHFFVGATFAATSVGITARVLSDFGRLSTPEARVILGAAVLDDVGALLVLAIVTALASGAVSASDIAVKTGIALGFLVAVLLLGGIVARFLFGYIARMRVRGAIVVAGIVIAVLVAIAAEQVGLAGIVGAFAAGLVLAQTREHAQIEPGVRAVGDLFVPFFFVIMGVSVDLRSAVASGDIGVILLVALALGVIAVLAKLACGLVVRRKEANPLIVGVGMVPRGEVGLIFAAFGLGAALITEREYAIILLVVMVTTIAAPLWLRSIYRRLAPHTRAGLADQPRSVDPEIGEMKS